MNVYGYVNGKPVYSHDEFIFEARHFGPIKTDEELMCFAEKVTYGWQSAGWKHKFVDYYLSDYALSEPYASLTHKEFERLRELQKEERRKAKEADDALEWKYVETIYWADNSVEETWINKYGETKKVTIVGSHGDAC